MRTSLRWSAIAGTVMASLLTTAPAQASVAEDRPWEYVEGYAFADVGWTLAGRVDGRPGNAHSGYFYFEDIADGAIVTLYDWRCPDGVTPPLVAAGETTCVLKATIYGEQSDGADGADFGTYLVRNRVQASVPLSLIHI